MLSPFLILAAVTTSAQFKINIPNAANPEPGDIVVSANKEVRTLICEKNSVFLRGNAGDFKISGACKSVHILGNSNIVYVENADRLVTEGNENTVTYRNPNMGVSTTGSGNHVSVARTDKQLTN